MTDRQAPIRVWSKLDLAFTAETDFDNAYADALVWVDLEGPGFSKRVYGFWDGGRSFIVRVLAAAPGEWRWTSGSTPHDAGLSGKSGRFTAEAWSADELDANPNRRGMIGATPDGRGLQYADGTPYFLLGDTWWSLPSFRFPLGQGNGLPDQLGPHSTLNDYVALRKAQGFNCIGLIAAQPAWANDGHPNSLQMEDGTWVRAAWKQPGTQSAKDMHNEGGRPFQFPGKVPGFEDVFPDMDRINPDYYSELDRKIDFLNDQGMVPFIEISRRDAGQCWKKFHDWPESYARYVHYMVARYGANITLFSPIHYDYFEQTIPAKDYNAPINLAIGRYGKPPFGTLLTANPNPSTLVNFGPDSWVDLHQSGNVREHYTYWYLTEMFQAERKPAINGEPYYAGLHQLGQPYALRVSPDSEDDRIYVRSGLYGSFLSGGLAGFIYGAEGIWQSDVEPESLYKMWDSFGWESANQVQHLRTFATVLGQRYLELVPDAELLVPNKTGPGFAYKGWSYCARTEDRSWFMLYFEADAPLEASLRGVSVGARYRPRFFDPRTGAWGEPGDIVTVARSSVLGLPQRPDSQDWGMMLERV
ncbi:apiosidase-like domain-containing protein [Pelagibacterium lentulum]|uniref:DUF4038 domain-containing protein n=1 Tax=Pelagibacterium lentulum TaxID=2029865 RepID=A0A916RB79_9HYPH|nr:DUF4038 domain-containing protein [Pelagibacterium lentulum]GGA50152.1 hypothetical protein GCM10011499_20100 [Pelagibacterium lentulum]